MPEPSVITCPHCGRRNEYHDGHAPEDVPKDGDLSLCWGCRQIAVYINGSLGMGLRLPTTDEIAEVHALPQYRQALAAMAESYDPVTAIELWRGSSAR